MGEFDNIAASMKCLESSHEDDIQPYKARVLGPKSLFKLGVEFRERREFYALPNKSWITCICVDYLKGLSSIGETEFHGGYYPWRRWVVPW